MHFFAEHGDQAQIHGMLLCLGHQPLGKLRNLDAAPSDERSRVRAAFLKDFIPVTFEGFDLHARDMDELVGCLWREQRVLVSVRA